MLYLAKVQKKTKFLSSGTTELKLLACQRVENHWSPVLPEEIIPGEDANNYNAGDFVLLDLTANKKVQRIQDASPWLVKMVQNYSRLQAIHKLKQQDLNAWEERLMHQAAQLNRREMEITLRQQQLEQQSQAMNQVVEEMKRLRKQLENERKRSMIQSKSNGSPISSTNQLKTCNYIGHCPVVQ
jgi:chromosome segregation ATPase